MYGILFSKLRVNWFIVAEIALKLKCKYVDYCKISRPIERNIDLNILHTNLKVKFTLFCPSKKLNIILFIYLDRKSVV